MKWIINDDNSVTTIHEINDDRDNIVSQFFEFCRNETLVKKMFSDDVLYRKHCHMMNRAKRMTNHLDSGDEFRCGQSIDEPLKLRIIDQCGGLKEMQRFNDKCNIVSRK